ncbi:uncharacterized protein V1518DRAFT_413149 [Limtongia smithiae]|uniref:uncharacterized protein n=1 Tax=Limtongia smithiae TaxID=1125753 RepID=UPI0034CD73E4
MTTTISDEEGRLRFEQLCEACRAGDIEQVDSIVSFGVDVNVTDAFDYSPLILASLCGHETVVRYLLDHGAVCDRDTFQGERCLYGALTDSIRNLLLKFDISKAVDAVQPFSAHISSLLSRQEPITADIMFTPPNLGRLSFSLHRFILAARSNFFREALARRWPTKNTVRLTAAADPQVFEVLVRHLYSADVIAAAQVAQTAGLMTKTIQAARKLDLVDLVTTLEEMSDKEAIRQRRLNRQENMRKAQADFEAYVTTDVIGKKIVVPQEYYNKNTSETKRFWKAPIDTTADVFLAVEDDADQSSNIILYPAHRAMLIRAEYFQTMFTSSFAEATVHTRGTPDASGHFEFPIVPLSTSNAVAEIILMFLYADRVDISSSIALDVLYVADLLFLDKLKSLAAIALTNAQYSVEDDAIIFDILHAGWATRMDRLERFAAKYFADNLAHFIANPDFSDVVVESAKRISVRDETDTIELIDDIRFYLAQKYGILFEDDMDPVSGKIQEGPFRKITLYERQFNEQLDLIDGLLESLNLDA